MTNFLLSCAVFMLTVLAIYFLFVIQSIARKLNNVITGTTETAKRVIRHHNVLDALISKRNYPGERYKYNVVYSFTALSPQSTRCKYVSSMIMAMCEAEVNDEHIREVIKQRARQTMIRGIGFELRHIISVTQVK